MLLSKPFTTLEKRMKKGFLFLADRNALINQPKRAILSFWEAMTVVKKKKIT
jgi:type I site-specific restriction endonuclease